MTSSWFKLALVLLGALVLILLLARTAHSADSPLSGDRPTIPAGASRFQLPLDPGDR
jgi:hypothetical protein